MWVQRSVPAITCVLIFKTMVSLHWIVSIDNSREAPEVDFKWFAYWDKYIFEGTTVVDNDNQTHANVYNHVWHEDLSQSAGFSASDDW